MIALLFVGVGCMPLRGSYHAYLFFGSTNKLICLHVLCPPGKTIFLLEWLLFLDVQAPKGSISPCNCLFVHWAWIATKHLFVYLCLGFATPKNRFLHFIAYLSLGFAWSIRANLSEVLPQQFVILGGKLISWRVPPAHLLSLIGPWDFSLNLIISLLAPQAVPTLYVKHSLFKEAMQSFQKLYPQMISDDLPAGVIINASSLSLRVLLYHFRKCAFVPDSWPRARAQYKGSGDIAAVETLLDRIEPEENEVDEGDDGAGPCIGHGKKKRKKTQSSSSLSSRESSMQQPSSSGRSPASRPPSSSMPLRSIPPMSSASSPANSMSSPSLMTPAPTRPPSSSTMTPIACTRPGKHQAASSGGSSLSAPSSMMTSSEPTMPSSSSRDHTALVPTHTSMSSDPTMPPASRSAPPIACLRPAAEAAELSDLSMPPASRSAPPIACLRPTSEATGNSSMPKIAAASPTADLTMPSSRTTPPIDCLQSVDPMQIVPWQGSSQTPLFWQVITF